jgi:hypothetical protein
MAGLFQKISGAGIIIAVTACSVFWQTPVQAASQPQTFCNPLDLPYRFREIDHA